MSGSLVLCYQKTTKNQIVIRKFDLDGNTFVFALSIHILNITHIFLMFLGIVVVANVVDDDAHHFYFYATPPLLLSQPIPSIFCSMQYVCLYAYIVLGLVSGIGIFKRVNRDSDKTTNSRDFIRLERH